MKKLTNEQLQKFHEAREELLKKILFFESGVSFPQNFDEQDPCKRTYWIERLKTNIIKLNFGSYMFDDESFEEYDDFEYGMLISTYFFNIKAVFLEEFGSVITPFRTALEEYENEILHILKS